MRKAAQQYLEHRGTKVVLLDEAHHIAFISTAHRACAHMNTLKPFGDVCGVKQVLFGTEALLPLLRGNAQLTRREAEIFFDAYDYQNHADLDAFNHAFCQFSRSLSCDDASSFETHVNDVFMRSAGCVGNLKCWMVPALIHALRRGRHALSYADLAATAVSDPRLAVIVEGVWTIRQFARATTSVADIRKGLGMTPCATPVRKSRKPPARKGSSPGVGVRKPNRDPVLPRSPPQ